MEGEILDSDNAAYIKHLEKRLRATNKALGYALTHLESLGWVPFGSHASEGSRVELDFSTVEGEDGFPLYERAVRLAQSHEHSVAGVLAPASTESVSDLT